MAEGFAPAFTDFPVPVSSAGTRSILRVDQSAAEVMGKLEIDISHQVPKLIDISTVGDTRSKGESDRRVSPPVRNLIRTSMEDLVKIP